MSEETNQKQTAGAQTAAKVATETATAAKTAAPETGAKPVRRRGTGARRDSRGGRGGRRSPRRERPKPEFDQKIVSIRRVTRVMAGGRRFSFSVTMIIGNRKGGVGVGVGKAGDTSLAIQKAYNNARKQAVQLALTEDKSLPFPVEAKYTASHIVAAPNGGRGVIAGSSLRTMMELSGMKDVTAKVHSRSKNQLNNARAFMKALEPISSPYKPPVKKTEEKKSASTKEAPKKSPATAK